MRNQYVVEWSHSSNNLHVQRLETTLAGNQKRFLLDKPLNDYHILFVGELDACSQFADHIRGRLHDREKAAV